MRLLIQRVSQASVKVGDRLVGQIDKGLFVLVGIKKDDSEEKAETLAEKLSKLRVMADGQDKMNLSVKELKAGVLVVSQFTLYADASGGNRPSFIDAALSCEAKKIYDCFIEKLKEKGIRVETGEFGAYMDIDAKLDGPVTILLEK